MKISKCIVSFTAVAAFAFIAGTMIVGCKGTTKETTTTTTTTETTPAPGADASPGTPAPSPDVTQKSTDSTTATTTNNSAPDTAAPPPKRAQPKNLLINRSSSATLYLRDPLNKDHLSRGNSAEIERLQIQTPSTVDRGRLVVKRRALTQVYLGRNAAHAQASSAGFIFIFLVPQCPARTSSRATFSDPRRALLPP